jgi:hypothetical protein
MNIRLHWRGVLVWLGIALAACYASLLWWHGWAAERRLIAVSHVSVVDVRTTFPPALIVDFENAGNAPIARTHFRLSFTAEGREISRADEDVLNIQPGEKRRIVLQSRSSGPARFEAARSVQAGYELIVLPGWVKGKPPLSGEFVLQP